MRPHQQAMNSTDTHQPYPTPHELLPLMPVHAQQTKTQATGAPLAHTPVTDAAGTSKAQQQQQHLLKIARELNAHNLFVIFTTFSFSHAGGRDESDASANARATIDTITTDRHGHTIGTHNHRTMALSCTVLVDRQNLLHNSITKTRRQLLVGHAGRRREKYEK